MKFLGQSSEHGNTFFLAPELKDIRAALQECARDALRPIERDVAEVEDGVEPRGSERFHQRRAHSRKRPTEGLRSKDSEFITRSTKPVS